MGWRTVRCGCGHAQLHADGRRPSSELSQQAAAYSSPKLEGPFLDAFWKHYKPQQLALLALRCPACPHSSHP
jgi:hypothetical protein